ncbi:MAG TPA: carboxypeptidase-like regulatory domain-containing protein [Pyrinomonadaceae bacterium]
MAAVLFSLLLACGVGRVGAQGKNQFFIYLNDESGGSMPGLAVTVEGPGFSSRVVTDYEGKLILTHQARGIYKITASWPSIGRTSERTVQLDSRKGNRLAVRMDVSPCSGIPSSEYESVTDLDRREILQQLIGFSPDGSASECLIGCKDGKPFFPVVVPDEFKINWIPAAQRDRLQIMNRALIQQITEKSGPLPYSQILEVEQQGACVEVTVALKVTQKARIEDKETTGDGASLYEFVKVNGRWLGSLFSYYVV